MMSRVVRDARGWLREFHMRYDTVPAISSQLITVLEESHGKEDTRPRFSP